jgi:hypothetical protein
MDKVGYGIEDEETKKEMAEGVQDLVSFISK